MRPYGETPWHGKLHDADQCGVCGGTRGLQDKHVRVRERRRARREIELQTEFHVGDYDEPASEWNLGEFEDLLDEEASLLYQLRIVRERMDAMRLGY